MALSEEIQIKEKISSHEFLKIEPFNINKRYTKPHKHNKYLEIVFFTNGSGFHYIDLDPLEIKPPIVFLIQKDQVHHWFIDTVPKGYVIIIKESFLKHVSDNAIYTQLNILKDLDKINIEENDKILPLLFEILCLEIKQMPVNKIVIESTLKAVLSKLIQYSNQTTSTKNTSIEIKFLQLLSETLQNNVSYYADKLNTTSQNLNAICKKSFQKSASEVIADFIIKDVKRQLLYTTKNVSDIAFEMNFKDTSNFTKFFKRYTSFTPSQFKKVAT